MMREWPTISVDDIRRATSDGLATGPFGSSVSSKYFCSEGVPLIRGSNLSAAVGERLVEDDFVFVSEEKAAQFSRAVVRPGDLVFTCWGTIGQIGLVDERARFGRYLVSNKQMKLTPDPTKADSLFLYYLFSSPTVQGSIQSMAIGSSVPGFNLGQLRNIRFSIPPLREQRAIAGVLGALDDKIESNRRTSRTLEKLARAIFRAWFVDFEPVKAKAAGARSFPSMPQEAFDALPTRFVDSELGPIPEGWNEGALAGMATLSRATLNPQEYSDEMFSHLSIPAYDNNRKPVVEPGDAIKSTKLVIWQECLLVSKLNPRIPRIWMPPVAGQHRQIASTEFLVTVPKPSWSQSYLYCLVQQKEFTDGMAQRASGTSNSHQRLKPTDYLNTRVVHPPEPLRNAFESVASPPLVLSRSADLENTRLAVLRDYLLPKLLSGEVKVTETERFTR